MTDESNLPPLARNVREVRDYRQLSQAELAERCKLSPKTIYLIEHGQHSPNVATLKAVAKALGVKLAVLLADPDAVSTTTRWLDDLRKLIAGASARFRGQVATFAQDLKDETTTRPEP